MSMKRYLNEGNEECQRVNQETQTTLDELPSNAKNAFCDVDFIISPLFFFLGLPLTVILLLCGYVIVPILTMSSQATFILKETQYRKLETLPKIFQKNVNPIVMDSVVVIYACVLAVFLQCSESIVVLVTCATVQLAVHWWTSYRLAKLEDLLQEPTVNCFKRNMEL